ncbi:MAG TPA: leucyl/phenylalanyl-tRNA--protein transferase [Bacteroidetes bacterium]|nr:leucyl/phenylalanyl-tRNA--protein transferase [Bacteroidota bacterium]HIL57537.1 leucyl/phenylalanyl-tRNA--protein transferase [Rhodothermales bacterium]
MLRPSILLHAYRIGLFPMADPDDEDRIYWYAPDPRALLPLDGLRVTRSLRQRIRRGTFRVSVDEAFERVISACAAPAPGREQTWISDEIRWAYTALHRAGYAHSVECWDADGQLAGGLYGVRLGGAFFGESMFSRQTDASKVALVHLVERLRAGGFALLDVQMQTDHLARMGAVEVSREAYEQRLDAALARSGDWNALDAEAVVAA